MLIRLVLLSMGWLLLRGGRALAFTTVCRLSVKNHPATTHHARLGKKARHVLVQAASATTETGQTFPRIIRTKGVPIHLYTNEIDQACLDQLTLLAESPIPTDYVSAMPDVHLGKGVTIGSVFASEKYVCPNAVGVDIGCGMVCHAHFEKAVAVAFLSFAMRRSFSICSSIFLPGGSTD